MQEDLLMREKKYGERSLQLRMEEFMSVCRDNQRKKSLAEAIKRGQTGDLEKSTQENGEKDLEALAKESLQQIEREFASFFEEREQHMLTVAQQCEDLIRTDTQ